MKKLFLFVVLFVSLCLLDAQVYQITEAELQILEKSSLNLEKKLQQAQLKAENLQQDLKDQQSKAEKLSQSLKDQQTTLQQLDKSYRQSEQEAQSKIQALQIKTEKQNNTIRTLIWLLTGSAIILLVILCAKVVKLIGKHPP